MANAFIDFSTTANSNTTVGSANIAENCAPSGINNAIRQEIAYNVSYFLDSNTIASASTTDLGAIKEGYVTISGTTTITSFGTPTNKTGYWVRFSGSLTLTYNGTSLILPGGQNIITQAGDVGYVKHEGSGNWRMLDWNPVSGIPVVANSSATSGMVLTSNGPGVAPTWQGGSALPVGFLYGLTLSNNGSDANNDIDIAAGKARDGGDTADMVLVSALTKRLDANWAVGTNQGGLDTGSEANSTWYHVWLIKRPDTGVVDALFSTSATAPTMPTNYTLKRRIGAVRNDGSGNLLAFTQINQDFFWSSPVIDVDATNPGTSAVTRTLTVPSGVKVLAKISVGMYNGSSSTGCAYVSSLDTTDLAVQGSATAALTGRSNAGKMTGVPNWSFSEVNVWTNTSSQVRSRQDISGAADHFGIITIGWTENL